MTARAVTMQSVNSSSGEEDDLQSVNSSSEEGEDVDSDEVYRRNESCVKCKDVQQSYGSKKMNPMKLSGGRYLAQLEPEETYECKLTGLIWEVSERVVVRYSVLPWSKFIKFLKKPWMIAGPIFNVETDPKDMTIKLMQLPHSLCLADLGKEKVFGVFGVLHITGGHAEIIERDVEYSGSHLKWSVSSLCKFGAIVKDTQKEHHGAVLLYQEPTTDESLILRAYLTANNASCIKDIKEVIESSVKSFHEVDKNAACSRPILVENNMYRLMSDQTGVQINPRGLPFTLATELKGRFDIQYEKPPSSGVVLKLQLKASDDLEVWSTAILKSDLRFQDDLYKLDTEPTGLCVIMNNEKFTGSKPRAGTNLDAVDLARTFSWLGFRVLMFKDQTKSQMEKTLKLLSSLENPAELEAKKGKSNLAYEWNGDKFDNFHANVDDPLQHGDAFVCCVMSHGEKGCVSGTDWGRLSIHDITATFNGVKCPLLDQKPKVFFIQACQIEPQPGGARADTSAGGDAVPPGPVVKAEGDFLVAMATVENYVAKRDGINGAPFMQCLWKRLKDLCPSGADLMAILSGVIADVAQKGRQMPEAKKFTLRKKLVFKPIS